MVFHIGYLQLALAIHNPQSIVNVVAIDDFRLLSNVYLVYVLLVVLAF